MFALRRLARPAVALGLAALLAACGGGGSAPAATATGGTGVTPTPAPTATPTPTPVANVAAVTIDAGPAALAVGPDAYTAFNSPFVSIRICAPGSATLCQTIDHIILDTGSVGVRLIKPALDPALLAALPAETDTSGNGVGECYQYVNSFVFGSVRKGDFSIAGESVANMPMQVIADGGTYASVPASCSAGGGTDVTTVKDFSANGIIGVGTTTTDCGAICQAGNQAAAIYYDCPASGCAGVIARAATASAPFEQLPNPVAAFATDNNGTILSLPAIPAAGSPGVTGTVTFGIGTQADNMLTSQHVLPVTTSSSRIGAGVLSATYNGKLLTQSFLDSGSNDYFFIDTSLAACSDPSLSAFYCPAAPMLLSPLLTGTNGATASGAFTLYNPLTTTADTSLAAPGLGVNPTLVVPPLPFANSFDFGLPFFYGRSVYTAIEGRPAGGVTGPYFAF